MINRGQETYPNPRSVRRIAKEIHYRKETFTLRTSESADIKPEQLFKGKRKEIEGEQLPLLKKPKKQTSMASEKHDFKLPKPGTYSCKGKDKDPETFKQ